MVQCLHQQPAWIVHFTKHSSKSTSVSVQAGVILAEKHWKRQIGGVAEEGYLGNKTFSNIRDKILNPIIIWWIDDASYINRNLN